MTVLDLKKELASIPDSRIVVFQGNIQGEEDLSNDNPTHTTCIGTVYSAWERTEQNEFVLDCAITSSEY